MTETEIELHETVRKIKDIRGERELQRKRGGGGGGKKKRWGERVRQKQR